MNVKLKIEDYVSKLQSILHLDISYFMKSSFWGGLQQGLGVASGLLVSYMFGHYVSKNLFGEYNLIISYISMLTFISLSGIDTALIRSIGEGYDNSLVYAFKEKFKYSLIGIPFFLLLGSYYVFIGNTNTASVIFVVALLFPFIYPFNVYTSFLTSKKKFRELALIAMVSSFFFVVTHVFSILIFPSIINLTLAYIFALILPAFIGYRKSLHYIKKTGTDPHLLSYGKFLTVINVLPWISGHIGNILLAHFIGPESLAIYSVASRLLVSVQKNFIVFHKPVRAKLAYQSNQEHIRTIITHSTKLIIIGIGLAISLWFFTPYFIHFFFTDTYSEAIRYGQLLSLALIPMPFTWVLADMLTYQKKRREQFILASLSPLIKIALYLILIPKWQINALVFILLLERYTDPLIPLITLLRKSQKSATHKSTRR